MTILEAIRLLAKEGIIRHTMTILVNRESGEVRQVEMLFEDDGFFVIRKPDGVEQLRKAEWSRK